jgi:predicted RNA-binding Zn ribbon-like protein
MSGPDRAPARSEVRIVGLAALARGVILECIDSTSQPSIDGDMKTVAESRNFGPARGTRAATLTLLGGRPCLDFTNTAHGRGTESHTDHLFDYAALVAWSRHAGVLDCSHAEAILTHAERHPRAAETARRRAIELREALHRHFAALARGRRPDAGDLAEINQALAAAMPHARVAPAKAGFQWAWDESEPSLDRMLWPIVRSAADLLTAEELPRVKQCAGCECGWLFLDLSKNGSRRWCEMEVCGSRAKARAYYARRKAAAGEH